MIGKMVKLLAVPAVIGAVAFAKSERGQELITRVQAGFREAKAREQEASFSDLLKAVKERTGFSMEELRQHAARCRDGSYDAGKTPARESGVTDQSEPQEA